MSPGLIAGAIRSKVKRIRHPRPLIGPLLGSNAPSFRPTTVNAANVKLRIIDAELQFQGVWEEVGIVNEVGQSAYNASAFMTVTVYSPCRVKLAIWSGAAARYIATTEMTIASSGTYDWFSPSFVTTNAPESMMAFAYYWNGSSWVTDDSIRGEMPLGHIWDVNGTIGRWYPNQYSDVIVTNDGTRKRATQYFWWWNNSYWGQTNGTTHLNRMKTWAARSNAWLWTIEFRRFGALPTFPNLPAEKDGWDFAIMCPDPHGGFIICGFNPWSSNIPGLRTGDVEENKMHGNEEAQFEVDNEQVVNLHTISGQDPHSSYSRAYYIWLDFARNGNYNGQRVYVMSGMQLQWLDLLGGGDEYFFYLHASGTFF